jgi:hypothetical protein
MGGGKGGSQTTQVQIPAWLENAAKTNLGRADQVAQIGYTPYYGPDVAAFGAGQNAAMANNNQAAQAFGMAPAQGGMPPPQSFGNGMQGYSSGSIFDQALAELQQRRPGQFNQMTSMFTNPVTGAAPTNKAFGGSGYNPGATAGGGSTGGAGGTGGYVGGVHLNPGPGVHGPMTGPQSTPSRTVYDNGVPLSLWGTPRPAGSYSFSPTPNYSLPGQPQAPAPAPAPAKPAAPYKPPYNHANDR